MRRWILLIWVFALTFFARVWNAPQILVDGQIYFVDADCYSRMSRVAAVVAHPGIILRHHDFENWPVGTTPHTTALFDYLIASFAWATGKIDLAGAVVPVLLGLGGAVILWGWVRQFRFLTQCGVLIFYAVCPILVHGTVFGRPDHQALLIFLLIVAFAAETELQKPAPKRWIAILHGLAWGFAFWTSLFEPAILFFTNLALGLLIFRGKWPTATRRISALSLGTVLVVAIAIEHWHTGPLPTGPLFERWAKSIGELAPVGWFSGTYPGWFGVVIYVLPLALGWLIFRDKNKTALHWGLLLLLTYILTVHAARWGYFMGIAVLFVLPVVFEKWGCRWLGVAFFLGFWPIAADWDARLWPSAAEQARLAEQREDYRQLRQICQSIHGGGVVAPWWLSPAVAYWSGGNGVAGSSHQSLPGTADTAQFYLSRYPLFETKAHDILRQRQVSWVLAYEPSRILSTSAALIGDPAARDALAITLYDAPRRAPSFLQLERETEFFRLYRVVGE